MSAPISPPPQQPLVPTIDKSRLPKGQCRYILLNPEIKGQRCACVCFMLNHDHPGVVCLCGHQSCYHIQNTDPLPDKYEVESLRHRIKTLEQQLDRDHQGALGWDLGMITRRLGQLEDMVEKNKEEVASDIKGCYRNISRTWKSIDEVVKRQVLQDVLLDERLDDQAENLSRLGENFRELNEVSISIEERIDLLEEFETKADAVWPLGTEASKVCIETTVETDHTHNPSSRHAGLIDTRELEARNPCSPSNSISHAESITTATRDWTVHISLLPSISQPFPFEKDTTAYKRCLSRGLHQMLVVNGADSKSFLSTVSKAFGHLLEGREWAPLHARICDAQSLAGLPMLRPLHPALMSPENYSHDFLAKHCGVLSPNRKIESLYIAMRHDDLSWHRLRTAPVFLEGLELSWENDPKLDTKEAPSLRTVENKPLASSVAAKKRAADEISHGVLAPPPPPSNPNVARLGMTGISPISLQILASEADQVEDCTRAAKVHRTTFDLPVPMKLHRHGEATALA